MKTVERKQELSILLPALIVNNLLETGKPPDIVEVRAVSPEIADEMEELGYSELTPDLFHAFMRTEAVEKLDPDQLVDLRGAAVSKFVGA